MDTINFWPILVASIVAFIISVLWYSPILFGKEWLTLSKISDADIAAAKAKGGMWKSYLVQFISTVIVFCVTAFIVSSTNSVGGSNGAFIGFLAWFGFYFTQEASAILWERKPFKLALISTVCMLLNLVIGGAIIGGWN